MEQGCRGKSACAVNDAMVTWSVSKGVQGPHGQDYRHGAGVNTLSVYTSGWLDVFTGISTQANDGETAHSGGLVGSLFPGPAHACCPDPVPGGQG